ncbi:MAG TPA: hypothetical protein DF613_06975, partial [Lachnospiraceae bacterium]|nr:hypothetical protein [Lachnospiraceae bacterium]
AAIPATISADGFKVSVTAVGKGAFKGCGKLTKVKIGSRVTSIGADAFYRCTKLKNVTIGTKTASIGKRAFYGTALKSFSTGNAVKTIGDKAFYGCKKLSAVTLGKNVATIGAQAFGGDAALKKITVKSVKLKKTGTKALSGIHKKAVIRVPAQKLSAYKKLFKGKGQKKTVVIKKN